MISQARKRTCVERKNKYVQKREMVLFVNLQNKDVNRMICDRLKGENIALDLLHFIR